MNTRISLYLDFARFTAALAVFLHHLLQEQYLGFDVRVPGRTAVIVFFVLSGFVIAFVTDGRERNCRGDRDRRDPGQMDRAPESVLGEIIRASTDMASTPIAGKKLRPRIFDPTSLPKSGRAELQYH
jgi:hypothetical protein